MFRATIMVMLVVCVAASGINAVASSAVDQKRECHDDARRKSRSLLQVHSNGEVAPTQSDFSLTLSSDDATGGEQTCACDDVVPQLLREQDANSSQQVALVQAQMSPPSCELFCNGGTCPCLLKWSERCRLRSCSACGECTGQTPVPTDIVNTPSPTSIDNTPAPTETNPVGDCRPKDVLIAIDASNSVKQDGWEQEQGFAMQLINSLLPSDEDKSMADMRVNAFWFNKDMKCIAKGANCGVNSPVGFNSDSRIILEPLMSTAYEAIKDSSTDHPQVFMTAKETFLAHGRPGIEKVLVLITDGETHNGEGCGSGADKKLLYESVVGQCNPDCNRDNGECDSVTQGNVCLLAQGKGNNIFPDQGAQCHQSTCMCGMYNAKIHQADYNIQVVGIANGFHDNELNQFKKQMAFVASSPSAFHFAPDFASLQGMTTELLNQLCD